ncbi:hypothetical protein A2634_02470 [Candidatus Amesbacteria bacterium RIFCSPHIGHO2_01_FULL_48_32]|uniref:histidine kinase n=1 Tax=Candidatus Amesbacteria bacterium RIFCSPLOWO2_01_FULL_48_25 TaxID=1797259 RepID=A0A1F4ZE43_9BACT|nr:MAG: hypothetical protein A2634_02470 [Candidatus Amesbacteria bacterium RIFCSPHIGHO2_01_FULL_48_32]OGD04445.1 MAG: hypothetical protein A2989_05465 [Candidatus Amesbacteria bacterium RIFCSPLOWO2_01_FULL_48_25]HJZ06293.1 HAMP domain-containing sensor histidine kinase [Patescibacteria group bacterium]
MKSQFVYSLFIILLVPTILALNTFFLLRSFRRDSDFELNNKALLVGSAIALHSRDLLSSPTSLSAQLSELIAQVPEIKAIEVFTSTDSGFTSIASTSPPPSRLSDSVLNSLSWGNNQAYSKQFITDFPPNGSQRVWLVATPITGPDGSKLGLVNLYLSAKDVDAITTRSTSDALVILAVSIVIVLLLLLNHFHLFQISVLFKKLKEIDQLKDNFISIASHELRAPLTSITNFAYVLETSPALSADSQLKKAVSVITGSTDRLKNLVADMLDVSRIEQNRVTLNSSPQDLPALISAVVSELLPQAAAKQLKLEYTPPSQPAIIVCDPDKMRQILTNLIGNAVKYTPTGSVTIYHQLTKNRQIKTFIADTGIGISAEDRPRLFTKFFRVQSDQTASIPGTGLGLWITKQLVEKMSGQITVDSIENKGSQFTLIFPLNSPHPTAKNN